MRRSCEESMISKDDAAVFELIINPAEALAASSTATIVG
jgi:hypothetical protein